MARRDDDKAVWPGDMLTERQGDREPREAMRSSREARMVSVCSPCTSTRSGLVSLLIYMQYVLVL